MNKDDLVCYAEVRGVKGLDRRKSQENLVHDIFAAMGAYEE